MTTWLPGAISARTARASSRVQNEWTPRPSAPGTGALTADEPGDQTVVVLEPRPVVEGAHVGPGVERCRAAPDVWLHAPVREHPWGRGEDVGLGDRAVEVVREDHARVRRLGAHQRDLRALAFLLADRADRVHARGAAADDEVSRRHRHRLLSDGGGAVTDSPRLAAAARTAAPRRPVARTTITAPPRAPGRSAPARTRRASRRSPSPRT